MELKTVGSLFKTCLTFIGKNILLVDSLCGIPDIIGQSLFEATYSNTTFLSSPDSEECHKVLKIFSSAYGSYLLSSLCLQSVYTRLGDLPMAVYEFSALEQLDLSDCRVDGHMIECIARMSRLKDLRLRHCSLTDEDLRRMTALVSMYDEGPKLLSVLDISYNKQITCSAVKFLSRLKNLSVLHLTGTDIKESDIQMVASSLRLDTTDDVRVGMLELLPLITCVGWAAKLIEDWLKDFVYRSQSDQCTATTEDRKSQSAAKFYGGGGVKRRKIEKLSQVSNIVNLQLKPVLLVAPRNSSQVLDRTSVRLTSVSASKNSCDLKTHQFVASVKEFPDIFEIDSVSRKFFNAKRTDSLSMSSLNVKRSDSTAASSFQAINRYDPINNFTPKNSTMDSRGFNALINNISNTGFINGANESKIGLRKDRATAINKLCHANNSSNDKTNLRQDDLRKNGTTSDKKSETLDDPDMSRILSLYSGKPDNVCIRKDEYSNRSDNLAYDVSRGKTVYSSGQVSEELTYLGNNQERKSRTLACVSDSKIIHSIQVNRSGSTSFNRNVFNKNSDLITNQVNGSGCAIDNRTLPNKLSRIAGFNSGSAVAKVEVIQANKIKERSTLFKKRQSLDSHGRLA